MPQLPTFNKTDASPDGVTVGLSGSLRGTWSYLATLVQSEAIPPLRGAAEPQDFSQPSTGDQATSQLASKHVNECPLDGKHL